MLHRAILALTALALVAPQPVGARAAGDAAARLQRALDDLAVMEALLSGGLNEPTRRELQTKLRAVRQEVQAVQQDLLRGSSTTGVTVGGAGGAVVAVTVTESGTTPSPSAVHLLGVVDAPTEGGLYPIGGGPFDALEASIAAESFGDEKIALLRGAARDHWFTVDQVIRLLPQFAFSDDRIEAAVVLYPRVVDPEVWFRVYDGFDFDSDKDEVRSRLGL